MSLRVWVIRVGGELHEVEACEHDLEIEWLPNDRRGLAHRVGNLTEQCDNCGAGGQDSTYLLVINLRHYECTACGFQYPLVQAAPQNVVFYNE